MKQASQQASQPANLSCPPASSPASPSACCLLSFLPFSLGQSVWLAWKPQLGKLINDWFLRSHAPLQIFALGLLLEERRQIWAATASVYGTTWLVILGNILEILMCCLQGRRKQEFVYMHMQMLGLCIFMNIFLSCDLYQFILYISWTRT